MRSIILAAVMLATAPLAANAVVLPNLLINGSFEQPGGASGIRDQITSGPGSQAQVDGHDITGWTYNGVGYAIYENNADDITAADGNFYIIMGHNSSSGESFTEHLAGIDCSAGCTLTYDVAEQQGAAPAQEIDVSVVTDSGFSQTVENVNIGSGFKAGAPITFSNGASFDTFITFTDVSSDPNANVAVDNFCLNASGACAASPTGFSGGAPEPTAWVLMLVGAGMAGAGLRRRRIIVRA